MKFEKPTLKEWNAAEKLADPVAFKAWVKRLVRRDKRYLKEVAAEMNISQLPPLIEVAACKSGTA